MDRIIIKNTAVAANIETLSPDDLLDGELALVREKDKERLYCKNAEGEIVPINRILDCGVFPVS